MYMIFIDQKYLAYRYLHDKLPNDIKRKNVIFSDSKINAYSELIVYYYHNNHVNQYSIIYKLQEYLDCAIIIHAEHTNVSKV